MTRNRQWLINGRPIGRPLEQDDFRQNVGTVTPPADGEVVVKVEYLGFDPAQKGWMENIADYVAPTEIGDIMRGSGIGEVVESRNPNFSVGDKVQGLLCWQEFATLNGDALEKLPDDDLLTANLGALGTTGMTAYFGLLKYGSPQPGDTVLVSGAAGATGSMVGQIAKLAGCRTVGIAGGKTKCDWLVNDVGFDAAIDYKNENIREAIRKHCPEKVNVFYDNVGGTILNDALANIAMHARVVVCGGISRYGRGQMPSGPENYFNLIFMRGTMRGFIVLDHKSEYPEARKRVRKWIRQGDIVLKEDVQNGFENIPSTLGRLFSGQNFGKQILKI
ncbi:MAG: NADP-dependent oxidoreductase [Pseudomonadota bacterium]